MFTKAGALPPPVVERPPVKVVLSPPLPSVTVPVLMKSVSPATTFVPPRIDTA